LIAKNKSIIPLTDKITLKTNQFCPVTFIGLRNIDINNENDRRIIKINVKYLELFFELFFFTLQTFLFIYSNLGIFKKKAINSDWEPTLINLGKSLISGAYLNKKGEVKKKKRTLLVCQSVINIDQRLIYMRSPIQV
jgi:hypothetical protein